MEESFYYCISMVKRILILSLILSSCLKTQAQNIGVGQWKAHLPQNDPLDLFFAGDRVYAYTQYGFCRFDLNTNETRALSKVDGYTEVGVQYADYSKDHKTIVIGYQNSNIDLQLPDGSIYNVPDLLNASVNGSKQINKLNFFGDYAFISCGFGILVYNIEKKESSADYKSADIHDVVSTVVFQNNIYAATSSGLFRAPYPVGGISVDASEWVKITGNGYHDMVQAGGNLYLWQDSLILRYDGSSFSQMLMSNTIRKLKTYEEQVFLTTDSGVYILTQSPVDFFRLEGSRSSIKRGNDWYYASQGFGMIRKRNGSTDFISPGGPYAEGTGQMASVGNTIYIAGGSMLFKGGVTYSYNGFYTYTEGEWRSSLIDKIPYLDTMYDLYATTIDPVSGDLWIAALEQGIARVRGKSILEFYDDKNSPIQLRITRSITGLAVDSKRNLWVANFASSSPLYVKSNAGQWDSFPNISQNAGKVLDLLIDKSGQKWMRFAGALSNSPGILVYNDNNTPFDKSDDPMPAGKILSTAGGSGKLPDNQVNCMTMDRNGQIWVGTDKGLTVFYSPSNIMTNNPSDSRQIVVGSGNDIGYLLGDERITAILVDGGNRKWIASRSGLWLVSPDGQEVLAHYDASSSPLFSNEITQLGMVEGTGELFIATDKGLMSLGTGSSLGGNVHQNVKVYPNPVRPGYSGVISISGLPTDARVKITDIAGNLIYETQANGGTATWNGQSFDGRKASSGVYMIFTGSTDGSDTFVSKVLIVN
ncbi:MAG: T9SS type A sorting domain-containing protein [Bacteroidetes bacterium]|nr:T9SS type A sorting domain-containing protein [Bacteroidota bacterium]